MQKNMNKKFILFSDLDGTFITYKREIPKINLEAVEKLKEQNGFFSIASGRSIEAIRYYSDIIKINAPAIVANGSIIYDYNKEKIIWDMPLPEVAKEYAKEIFEKFSDIGMEIHSGHDLYLLRNSLETAAHIRHEKVKYNDIDSFDRAPETWHKVLLAASQEKLKELSDYCLKKKHKGVKYCYTAKVYFEMLNESANKGKAIKKLAEYLGIDEEYTYAIGDYYNDVEMIKAAGYSFLAGNAPKELHYKADKILCKCEDGAVAQCIDYILKTL